MYVLNFNPLYAIRSRRTFVEMGSAAVKWTKQLILHIYYMLITLECKFCIESNVFKKSPNDNLSHNLVKHSRGYLMEYGNRFEPT